MEYFTYYWLEKYIALQKKDSDLVSNFLIFRMFFNGICNHALVICQGSYTHQIFVLCMINGSAMHLNGVTVTIALKSGKWGLFTQFLLSLILGVYASYYETKQKQNQSPVHPRRLICLVVLAGCLIGSYVTVFRVLTFFSNQLYI